MVENSLKTTFEGVPCLAEVDAEVECVAEGVESSEISDLNLFLTPSEIIDGTKNELRSGVLRHMHHRSVELPERYPLSGKRGVFSTRRLKGPGLYSGPSEEWMHKVRNLKKDDTGLVLGLQSLDEFRGAFDSSQRLADMGIETEFPMGALRLHEVIFQTRDGAARLKIADAFDQANLPPQYKEIPFVIRVDAIGINHRLKDYIFAGELLANTTMSTEVVRQMLIADVQEYLNFEGQILGHEVPDLTADIQQYIEFILKRIFRNVALLHKNGGVHGQLTEQNLTMDGKFIDYDTLKWLTGDDFEAGRVKDLTRLNTSIETFLRSIMKVDSNFGRLLEIAHKEYEIVRTSH